MGKITKKKKTKVVKNRKELRKEKRLQKKENKRSFFGKKKSKAGQLVKNNPERPADDSDMEADNSVGGEDVESDFELSDDEMNAKLKNIKKTPVESKKPAAVQPDRFLQNQRKEKKQQEELQKKMRKRRIEQLKSANEEDDMIIRRLEKKLRINKHKNDKSVHKMFDDGLDYAMELCLPENIEKMYKAAKDAAESEESDDGFEDDLAAAMGERKSKKKPKEKQSSDEKQKRKMHKLSKAEEKYFKEDFDVSGSDSEFGGDGSQDEDGDGDSDDSEPDSKNKTLRDSDDSDFDIVGSKDGDDGEQVDSEIEKQDSVGVDEDASEESGDEEGRDSQSGEDSDGDNDTNDENGDERQKKEWEDIYGRKRDVDGNVIEEKSTGKYVPPHVRARLDAENPTDSKRKEKLANLQRHCKGFLNRLSEANIHKIVTDIENLYRSNSRFDMNNTLTKLITEAIISHVITAERMVLEYAMLVAALHANVGSEVGAHFLETLVVKIVDYIKNIHTLEVENKEFDNTVFLLCHMYTFKIFHNSLVYEILKRLTDNLCEKSVECLLLVLRSVGFQLRKDDPLALKDLILLIQKKAGEAPLQLKENPRLKFMIEILLAIKNNNMTKIPQYDPSLAEHLKKILKSMMVNGKYVATMNITIDDLLNADEKGKWWVVGSAWSGNIKDINAAKKAETKDTEKFSDQLLALARQQRMNTEDRRNVFCIVMSAEDYINAFERLLHLSIKDQRVIVTVIIHCCLSEKVFNPYYGALIQKICEYDRKYQLATQFALWDRIKEVRASSKEELNNLAKLCIYLISKGGQPLSVLKVIEFGEMDKPTLRFVRQIMLGLLLGKEDECCQIFARIAPSTKLGTFKDSLRLFMHHFLLKGSKQNSVDPDKMHLLKERINIADEALQTRDSKVKF